MKSQTAFVGPQRGVELHPVASVDLYFILVVLPDDAELDHTLWDGDDLEGGLVFRVFLKESGVFKGGGELCERVLAV